VTVRIAWEEHGEGPPLVLVHGLGYARWGWEPVVDGLAARFRLVLLDNRGVGASDAPSGPYTVAQLAGDVLGVMDAAGVARAHVLGTSLGGMVAQELAITAPARVDRLVLVGTTPGGPRSFPMPDETVRLIGEALTSDPAVMLRRLTENALAPGIDGDRGEIVDRIVAHRTAAPQAAAAWAAQASAGATFERLDALDSIESRTLVLHGDADRVVDPRNADLLAERIRDARLVVLPGTGHLLFWEQPERFVEIVTGFLAESA
jgi:pimeloyl-ACP methyl ester carboxylesterase